ncbi:hypothetical protein F5Y18DRAFT_424230 [Xylariaceae sp. FL1019]|nr:hypothetical protein F5Y18DRAFT_424230 [Xylariaceae sp. FL1019]
MTADLSTFSSVVEFIKRLGNGGPEIRTWRCCSSHPSHLVEHEQLPKKGETLIQRLSDSSQLDSATRYFLVKLATWLLIRGIVERSGQDSRSMDGGAGGECSGVVSKRPAPACAGLTRGVIPRPAQNDLLNSERGEVLYREIWDEVLAIVRGNAISKFVWTATDEMNALLKFKCRRAMCGKESNDTERKSIREEGCTHIAQ